MPTFLYNGKDIESKKQAGYIVALDYEAAISKLHSMDIIDCDVYETTSNINGQISYTELSIFSKQMATLYRTNISLLEGLLLVKEQVQNKDLQIVILELHKLIHEGCTLATAISMYTHIFGEYFINIVDIAEMSGTLESSFDELYRFYKEREAMRKKIINTVVYPTILSIALMFIVTFVVIKVMPIFNDLLISYGIEMPMFTKIVMNSSIWIGNNIIIVAIILATICAIIYFYAKTEKGQNRFRKAILKFKAFNSIQSRIIAINFSKSVSSLLRSGMILSNAFELSNNLVEKTVFSEKFEKAKDDIKHGEDFYCVIQELGIYPMFYAKMLSIGNKTGALDDAFNEVANMLQEDLEEDIERVQKLFEPLLMLFLGGVVTVILVSVALPMINILENII